MAHAMTTSVVRQLESLFGDGRRRERDQSEALQAERYQQIGRLNMELEWLKKKVARGG
jgi:hypothetical protein